MNYFIKGLGIGFLIAAPVGPIGVLCIKRSLTKGRISGLATGFGAATADGLYGGIAAFGLTALSSLLLDFRPALHLAGAFFLLYLGGKNLRRPVRERVRLRDSSHGIITDYLSSLLLTLTSPATILSFLGIFAGMGLVTDTLLSSVLLVSGVFTGSTLWWIILSYGAARISRRMEVSATGRINKISGFIFLGFGLFLLYSLLLQTL